MMNKYGEKKQDLIFGIRTVIEAISAGKDVERILIKKGLQGELSRELSELLKDSEIPVQYVPIEKLNRVTQKNHQGVIAFLSPITYQSIENILPGIFEAGKIPFILVLDGITDVRNFGAIARTAECAGADAIIIPSKGAAQINSDAMKTSAGALHKIPVCRVEKLKNTLEFLRNSGLTIIGATEKTEKKYFDSNYEMPVALVMGSEDLGISNDVIRACDDLVQIPIIGEIQSLNVSVAAGIIMYEIVKQRIKTE